jgi:hypothetical protein
MNPTSPKDGLAAGASQLSRAVYAMSRPSQFREFWRLMGRFEELTVQESIQIQRGDFALLEGSQREKYTIFGMIQELGAFLGLDRSNLDLRLRLESLEKMERHNLELIDKALCSARGERQDAERTRVNLRSLRGSYLRETGAGDFFAEG